MRTGKILSIGAALSAGLLVASVASASVSLEVYQAGVGFHSAALGSSGSYGGLSWTSATDTIVNSGGTASLELSLSGLSGTGDVGFLLSDSSFSQTGSGLNLAASVSGGSGALFLTTVGFADGNNALFGVPQTNAGSYPSGSVVSESSGAYNVSAASPQTINLLTNYSLTTNAVVNLIGGSVSSAHFTTSVTGAAPSAVTLPGSGPLTIIGGLVMVGGLAIRRRMKA